MDLPTLTTRAEQLRSGLGETWRVFELRRGVRQSRDLDVVRNGHFDARHQGDHDGSPTSPPLHSRQSPTG
jgi:hypothetical protein